VRIIGLAQRGVRQRHFERVATALARRKRLQISYAARGTGETSGEKFRPAIGALRGIVSGRMVPLRNGLRSFALDAIAQAQPFG